MTPDSTYRILTLWVLAVVIVTVAARDFNLEENVKELLTRRKNLEFMKQLVEDMDHQFSKLQKRTCYINAGMSHGCDYQEMNKNTNDQLVWEDGPGKRKRSSDTPIKEDMGNFLRSMKILGNRKRR